MAFLQAEMTSQRIQRRSGREATLSSGPNPKLNQSRIAKNPVLPKPRAEVRVLPGALLSSARHDNCLLRPFAGLATALLDTIWSAEYALAKLTDAGEAKIRALIKKAVS
jgi:hypothetical protein